MYSRKEIDAILEVYDRVGSVLGTVKKLGYPDRKVLAQWIRDRKQEKLPDHNRQKNTHKSNRQCSNLSHEERLDSVRRCFLQGESVDSVAKEIGSCSRSIYNWRHKFLKEGLLELMPYPKKKRQSSPKTPSKKQEGNGNDIEDLRAIVTDLQMEVDILRETIKVLKKDPGVDLKRLRNREKVVIVDALREQYSLPNLLTRMDLPKSSYYYHREANLRLDKYSSDRQLIQKIFEDNHSCYGYRRIKAELNRQGRILSEKVVRRIMKEERLSVKIKRKRRYLSYKGEISPEVPNLLKRDFHADKPNEKWLTDITEFSIPAGKIYLSPIIDCYDGMVVSWSISTHPNAKLANSSLKAAASTLKGECPIIHSDRGCHYRWPEWIKLTKKYGLIRSMSKKGCSPDNSACEGFFGRLKNECFYSKSFNNHSVKEFIAHINDYIVWYNESRIKMKLGACSPIEFRQLNGYVA